jgi:hypothetical protein
MSSSGKLRRVAPVRFDVSEERIASIIRVTRIGELRTTLAINSDRSTLRRNIISSEILVLTRATRRHNQEDGILHFKAVLFFILYWLQQF